MGAAALESAPSKVMLSPREGGQAPRSPSAWDGEGLREPSRRPALALHSRETAAP